MSSADSIFADTIYALATSAGKAGVAVIRLSGVHALQALRALTGLASVSPRSAYYATFRHPATKAIIDRGIALYFAAPHSFTGEDVVECQLHGSPVVICEMLEVLGGMDGLRPADAGEFSRRAFTYGKMDLMEAEGLADLIDAQTSQQKAQAMRQMEGGLSSYYDEMRMRITRLLAHLEAYIDFPDEEIPEAVLDALSGDIMALQAHIRTATEDRRRGERLREGISVVIVGAPNAGKSSLLNLLARRDAAIVSYKAGTTRDLIEIQMDIAGYPVVLVDTAGIRESDEEIEAEGIRRALKRAGEADIRLVLLDGSQLPGLDTASLGLIDESSLVILSKSDLTAPQVFKTASVPMGALELSAKTGEGLDTLLKTLEERVVGFFSAHGAPFITRERHRALLGDALKHLDKSLRDAPLELKCEELRLAAQAVGKITGKIQVDDVLDVIFKSFCIGK